MARPGVTYQEAQTVFVSLLTNGESLSAQKARQLHGSGSNSTWLAHLNEFRDQQKQNQFVSLPETLPESLVPLIEVLWTKAVDAAGKQFTEERSKLKDRETELEKDISDLNNTLQMLRNEVHDKQLKNDDLNNQLLDLTSEIDELKLQVSEYRTEVRKSTKEVSDLKAQLNTKQEEIIGLQQEHKQALEKADIKFTQEAKRNDVAESKWIKMFDDKRVELESANKSLSKLQKVSQDENKKNQQLILKLKTTEQKLESFETETKLLHQKADALSLDTMKMQKDNAVLVARKEELERQVNSLTRTVEERDSQVNIQNEKLLNLSISLARLESNSRKTEHSANGENTQMLIESGKCD